MQISNFEEFLTLAETGSFSNTAEIHYVSYATLSRHLHALEDWSGEVLIQREGNHTVLTQAGKTLLPYVRTIVETCNKYREENSLTKDRPNRNISISATVPLSFYGITEAIEKYHRDHTQTRIDVRLSSPNQVNSDLLNNNCDFAVSWHKDDISYGLTAIPLKKIVFAALIPASHKLAEKEELYITDLKNEPLIFLDDSFAFYNTAVNLCLEAGFSPRIQATAHRAISIEDLVSGGFGIGFLPVDHHVNFHENIVSKTVLPRSEVVLDLIYNSSKLSERGHELLQFLCDTFAPGYVVPFI